jgi:hypothetical protein
MLSNSGKTSQKHNNRRTILQLNRHRLILAFHQESIPGEKKSVKSLENGLEIASSACASYCPIWEVSLPDELHVEY